MALAEFCNLYDVTKHWLLEQKKKVDVELRK
jgi:hypothetical protein